jgi:ribonuclease BN (tRNA processing enzyme)
MSGVDVIFVGSGDAFGSGGRFQTCIHVRAGSTTFLIDCGASSLIAMRRFGLDPSAIGTVLLSHLHGDHFGGLPFFVLDAQFAHRGCPLMVAGPRGVAIRVTQAMEVMFPGSPGARRGFELNFTELSDGAETVLDSLKVTPFAVRHPSGADAFALRVECGGRAIGYSGDTEWTEALTEAARGTDLFISEAYFFDKKIKHHLDYATLSQHRHLLDTRRLVLTHMSADMLARIPTLDIEVAEDGKRISL